MSQPPALSMFGLASAGAPSTAGPSIQHAITGHVTSTSSVADSERPLRSQSLRQTRLQDTASQPSSDAIDSDGDSQYAPQHRTYTDYMPYRQSGHKMMTQTSMLSLPRRHPTHDLAFFLRTTGPARIPAKSTRSVPSRAATVSRNALRLLGVGSRKNNNASSDSHDELDLLDEGGLLLPSNVQQKISSTGKKYLALHVPASQSSRTTLQHHMEEKDRDDFLSKETLGLSSSIYESRVSISLAEDLKTDMGSIVQWYCNSGDGGRNSPVSPISDRQSTRAGAEYYLEKPIERTCYSPSPIRPQASNPPTPPLVPASAVSDASKPKVEESARQLSITDKFSAQDGAISQQERKPVTPMPVLSLPHEEFPVKLPRSDRDAILKHPSPRRLASPAILEQTATAVEPPPVPPVPELPETPPPRSPLRLRRDARTIEAVLAPVTRIPRLAPKLAPPIEDNARLGAHRRLITPTVTTECTGPLTRPEQKPGYVRHHLYPMSRKEREEKTRARKLRDRPSISRTIDAVVSTPQLTARQRLRKARPSIQHQDLIPAPLSTRSASLASSDISWRQIDESLKSTPAAVASPRPSADLGRLEQRNISLQASPAKSVSSARAESRIESSPVAMVAEEMAITKAKPSPRTTRLVVRERLYTPRPRSASMPRLAGKRMSRASYCGSFRVTTPEMPPADEDDMPALPSPPPNRALPPTPPASGSEGLRRKFPKHFQSPPSSPPRVAPFTPLQSQWSTSSALSSRQKNMSTTQEKAAPAVSSEEKLHAVVEALQKQVQSLEATLRTVLLAHGGGPINLAAMPDIDTPKTSMTWESRVTRRSEASHAASSSNGSALDMYMNTRTEGQMAH